MGLTSHVFVENSLILNVFIHFTLESLNLVTRNPPSEAVNLLVEGDIPASLECCTWGLDMGQVADLIKVSSENFLTDMLTVCMEPTAQVRLKKADINNLFFLKKKKICRLI